MNTTFSISSFIKSGWQTFKTNWKFIVLAVLATGVIEMILNTLQESFKRSSMSIASFVVSIFVTVIGLIISIGWAQVILALNRNGSANWDTFKTNRVIFLRYIKSMIWYVLYFVMWAAIFVIPGLIIWGVIHLILPTNMIIGIILGVVIGVAFLAVAVYFAARYQFVIYAALDYPELRSKAIFKKAGEITQGHLWKLIGFSITLGLLNILGMACLLVGLLVTIPVSKLAQARAYDYLKNKKGEAHTDVIVRPEEVAAPATDSVV